MKTKDISEFFLQVIYENKVDLKDIDLIDQLSIEQAYEIQDEVMRRRIAKGEKVVGYKVGCTSTAIQKQFGLNEPIYARLYEPYIHTDNEVIDWCKYLNCAIEPEMVIRINRTLQGMNLTNEEIINSIEYIVPGIELHNFKFWKNPATIQELICSGGIHAGLIIGNSRVSPYQLSFSDEAFSVFKNDKLITSAKAKEIMSGPLNSLRWLINKLTLKNESLLQGSYVIPGSPVELVNIDHDMTIKIKIDSVGVLQTKFKKNDY